MTPYPHGVSSFGIPLYGDGSRDISGKTWFVDGNSGLDSNDGLTWETAKQTLAPTFALSQADIANSTQKHWARRNTIYIAGDDFTEDLVALPQKTDVIGVGSSDPYQKPCIRGNHAPVDGAYGTRFFNIRFRPAASSDMFTLASTTGAGLQFWKCYFEAQYSTYTAPSAIDTTACARVKVMYCEFSGAFSSDYIDIGAGDATGMEIAYNKMVGSADNGVMTTGTVTVSASHMGKIHHNFIQCADKIIDTQATSVFCVYDNVGISGEALGSSSYVIDLTYAARNCLTGNDVSVYVPSLTTVA